MCIGCQYIFKVYNGAKQGGVLSPVLFALYIDELFERLANCGHGCHVGIVFVGCISYADYIKNNYGFKRTLNPYFRNLPLLHITIRLHLTWRLLKFTQWLARKQYLLCR